MANIILEELKNFSQNTLLNSKEVKDISSVSANLFVEPIAGSELSQISPEIIQKLVSENTSQTKNDNKSNQSATQKDVQSFSAAGVGLGVSSFSKIIFPALAIAIVCGMIILLLKKKSSRI